MPVIKASNLKKFFSTEKGIFLKKPTEYLRAVDNVSFSIPEGETLGLVGESGSGKSTIGNMILRLIEPTSGEILYKDRSILAMNGDELRSFRSKSQMVFQNPFASLNPRMTIKEIIGRVLKVQGLSNNTEIRRRIVNSLEEVGLREDHVDRYPHEFSGGQRQRIAIAKALISNPEFLVLDEPTSALDVSVQAQILNIFREAQERRSLTYLFISHDLSVIKHISHRVAVLYLGVVMEYAPKGQLFSKPLHPYTKALIHSIPKPYISGEKIEDKAIKGDIPSPINTPTGCRFNTRCPLADDICKKEEPLLREVRSTHFVACHKVSSPTLG